MQNFLERLGNGLDCFFCHNLTDIRFCGYRSTEYEEVYLEIHESFWRGNVDLVHKPKAVPVAWGEKFRS